MHLKEVSGKREIEGELNIFKKWYKTSSINFHFSAFASVKGGKRENLFYY